MMTEDMKVLSAKLDMVLARLEEMKNEPKPGLTQVQFAVLIGRSPRTVSRMIRQRKIRLEHGVIPASEARKFLS